MPPSIRIFFSPASVILPALRPNRIGELLKAQHYRTSADVMLSRNGFVTLAVARIQKNGCAQSAQFLLGSGTCESIPAGANPAR
jgi:hypothetical protein